MSPSVSQLNGMSVGKKLLLLTAVPVVVTAALLLALFVWGHARSVDAYEQALAWERHAEALRNLDWAARFYVDTVADGITQDAVPHRTESGEKLARARAEALVLAGGFSFEEQRDQERVDGLIAAVIEEGERVGKDRERLEALSAKYRKVVETQIQRRVLEEENGAAAAVQRVHDFSNAVRIGGFSAALLVLLIAVVIGTIAIRGFGGRVASLQSAAARVASGDLEQRVAVTSADELGQLARSLNLMIEALRRQRTRQLGFLAAVAHDLKNALGAMSLSTQALLQNTEASTEPILRKSLTVMERQIQRLVRMANDLLDAASIEAGELKLERRTCDLRAVARDVTELYAAASSQHELRLSVPPEPVVLVCDPTRIAQMLDNLVSNAIKYSPEGGTVEVTVAAAVQEIVVSVADTGVGIEPGMSDVIFEPFRRLAATKDVLPGVGLGLSICRRIVVAHGGHIDVASEIGRGTRFDVHLPRRLPSDEPPRGAARDGTVNEQPA